MIDFVRFSRRRLSLQRMALSMYLVHSWQGCLLVISRDPPQLEGGLFYRFADQSRFRQSKGQQRNTRQMGVRKVCWFTTISLSRGDPGGSSGLPASLCDSEFPRWCAEPICGGAVRSL